jgi:hypothetical protein
MAGAAYHNTTGLMGWPKPDCLGFRSLVAHRRLIPYLDELLSRGWRLSGSTSMQGRGVVQTPLSILSGETRLKYTKRRLNDSTAHMLGSTGQMIAQDAGAGGHGLHGSTSRRFDPTHYYVYADGVLAPWAVSQSLFHLAPCLFCIEILENHYIE